MSNAGLILTVNAGSSSLKSTLYDRATLAVISTGAVDRIGGAVTIDIEDDGSKPISVDGAGITDHTSALSHLIEGMGAVTQGRSVTAIGHRVVHGGADLTAPAIITDDLMAALAGFEPFAPLHQIHNLNGIRAAQKAFPDAVQVACFDTAFHRTNPWVNQSYGLPRQWFDKGVQRYGFHGLSYEYIAGQLSDTAPELSRVVVAHLGNGASLCAMRDGRSVATSMGFTPLDGLTMGTRCGQIDPGVLLYLMQDQGMTAADVSHMLYHDSGLKGLSGLSNDMRTLEASDDPDAGRAIEYFVARVQRHIGDMAAALCGIDGLVFTGGIGENAATIRERICDGTRWMGLHLDPSRNTGGAGLVSAEDSQGLIMVIPTDENAVIARATRDLT